MFRYNPKCIPKCITVIQNILRLFKIEGKKGVMKRPHVKIIILTSVKKKTSD